MQLTPRQSVSTKLLDYLKTHVKDFKSKKVGHIVSFTCPKCKQFTANEVPHSHGVAVCHTCKDTLGDVVKLFRLLEPEKAQGLTDEQIVDVLAVRFNMVLNTETKVNRLIEFYEKNGFDLVPIQPNGKVPIEKEWTQKNHKNPEEWRKWLTNGWNIGIKTGAISNVTVIDIDSQKIPQKVWDLFTDVTIVQQQTKKGYHFFFKYDKDLPKTAFDFEGVHIDIENDGGQVVAAPSVVDGHVRGMFIDGDLSAIPEKLKEFILEHSNKGRPQQTQASADANMIASLTSPDNYEVDFVGEGNRNNTLIRLGGILRKSQNSTQVRNTLQLINSTFIKPPLSQSELNTLCGSLDKYLKFEAQDISKRVLDYLKVVGDATARDIKEVLNEPKELVDKSLAFLAKEGYVIKKNRAFHIIRRIEWREAFMDTTKEVDFKMPYFHDIAHFADGDMVLLGGRTKGGKTTLIFNVIKALVDQGLQPKYVSLENGSRFAKTALKLGLKEGDFKWSPETEPTKIELDPGSITIIDWLYIEDFATTNVIIKHLSDQLSKAGGILIVLSQLKEDGTWFAPNLIKNFPAFAARYLYDNESDGTMGYWSVDAIRDPKSSIKSTKIPCQYDWHTRLLRRVDELDNVTPILSKVN